MRRPPPRRGPPAQIAAGGVALAFAVSMLAPLIPLGSAESPGTPARMWAILSSGNRAPHLPPLVSTGAGASSNWNWTNLANVSVGSSIPGRSGAGIAADPSGNDVIVFGGLNATNGALGDTWSFNENWSWAPVNSRASPVGRAGAAMAYDASSNSVVLFSGRTSAAGGLVRDTWSFAQGQWTQLHPAISPPARFDSSLVPDANGTGLILFGGLGNATNGVLNDTWWYHAGSSGPYWTNLTSSAGPGPSARWGAASANLSSLRVDVLYGGNSWNGTLPFTNGSLSDTWLFDGSRWHLQSTKTNPGPRYSASLAFDQVDGVDVLFGGFNRTGHPIGSTWIFNGSAWFAPNLGPVRPHARVGGAMTWATGWARGIDLLVGGAYGGSEVFGGPYAIASEIPLIVTTPVGSSTSTDPQSPVTFTEATFGGVPPLQYHWNDLPLPCTGMNGPAVACIPNASSTNSEYFQPFVSVEDAVNEVLNSSATYLVVYAPLSLSSLDLAPDPVNVGTAVTISVQRTGGASPLNLTYTGLPPGCVSENLTSFTCTPTAAGTYDVNVTAVDPYGESASLVSTVTVQSNGLSAQTTTGLWYLGFGAVLVASVIFLGIRRSRQKASSRPSPSTPLAPWTPPAETSRSPPSEPPNRPGA